jgi:hypothetical protein
VMHDDGEPQGRPCVLDRDLAAGDPDELWWRAHSQTLPAPFRGSERARMDGHDALTCLAPHQLGFVRPEADSPSVIS